MVDKQLLLHMKYCPTDTVWDEHGLLCYIVLLDYTNGVTYGEAKDRCSKINGTVIMPKTKEEEEWITSKVIFGRYSWVGLTDYDVDDVFTWEDGTNDFLSTLYWYPAQPNGRDNACVCAVMINGELNDVDCRTPNKVVCQVDAKTRLPTTVYDQSTNRSNFQTTTLPAETTRIPATFYNQTTNYMYDNLETTILPTKTTGIPATFYNQKTMHVDLETTAIVTDTTGIPATVYNQTTKHVDLETTTLRAETTSIPPTFYNHTTKHVDLESTKHSNLETTTVPVTNMSLTLTSLECEDFWMNQCKCNCQELPAIPEIHNDIITYRLDKTTLSSYIRKRSSASDPRKSSFYIGCVGITVLVLSILFIVVLDLIPRG
ncbi:uncharacterized protein LOC134697620 [Mytilus trossulus]|uniref:uncharacterized protein LOC134697620 n=1 Tax=Mytilus trossulus TaxID=6551 RepID=UPI0030076E91